MGREMKNPVRRFFSYDYSRDLSTCCINGCNKFIKGNHAANLERHVSRLHPNEHAHLMKLKQLMAAEQKPSFIAFVPQQAPAAATQKQTLPAPQTAVQPPKLPQPQQPIAPKPIAPKPPPPRPVSPLQTAPPEVCLRWNSYHSNMQATFPSLLNNEQFVDVTLACEGRSIKCHKVMLSACSAYFEELLSQNPCQHPIVFMKDLRYWEVQALVDFMYRGEVNVGQDKLPSLLAAAEALQIKGLAGPASSSTHDEDCGPSSTQSSAPMGSAEDYLDESVPSPSAARRARKRRVMNTSSLRSVQPQPPQPHAPAPVPGRSSIGKQRLSRPSVSMPSTSDYHHSEPPSRRARKSDMSDLVGEIKIEPVDLEVSNDSMDQIDDSFMEKTYEETETGDVGESSVLSDDPGGTSSDSKGSRRTKVHGQGNDQMDFGNDNSISSANDQNFKFDDSSSHDDGLGTASDIPGPSYQTSVSQPSGSGINSESGGGNVSDSMLGHL